jgi:flagellar biosynthesis protein FlhB
MGLMTQARQPMERPGSRQGALVAASGADKTEKPTAKKRQDARRKGQGARSSELPQSISLIVSAIMLPAAMPDLMRRLADVWSATFAPDAVRDADTVAGTFGVLTWEATRALLPLVVVVTATSIIAQLALIGERPNPHKLKPQWQGLNPKNGLMRIVGPQAYFELAKTLGKLGLVALVAWSLWDEALENLLLGPTPMAESLPALMSVLENLFVRIAVIGILIGVIDAVWNKYRHDKSLRMTKQEVREEQKQQESSPLVKGEIRRRQQALSRNRMIHAVATADVVITNPTHLAVALSYSADDPAPRVVAKGAGVIADRIRAEARLHGVPIREDKPVARTLFKNVEIGDLVPVELYAAIAEILAAIYRARR